MLEYRVKPKRNPYATRTLAAFYARATASFTVVFSFLAHQIAYKIALTNSYCNAVLYTFEGYILWNLKQNQIVKIGRLGSFNLKRKPIGQNELVGVGAASNVKGNVCFRLGKKQRREYRNAVSPDALIGS